MPECNPFSEAASTSRAQNSKFTHWLFSEIFLNLGPKIPCVGGKSDSLAMIKYIKTSYTQIPCNNRNSIKVEVLLSLR